VNALALTKNKLIVPADVDPDHAKPFTAASSPTGEMLVTPLGRQRGMPPP